MTRLVAIVGPTAAGKSAAGLKIAQALSGEIVNADSRLFYRGVDIGTAKPSLEDRAAVAHHLIDILEPSGSLGLAMFIDRATAVITDVADRGRLPILVGGTGQYVWGLLEGWDVPSVPADDELRVELEELAERDGHDAVFRRLKNVDLESAARIDSRNVRRVIRAIEVAEAVGPGAMQGKAEVDPFDALILGITVERNILYQRIDARIDSMLQTGWVEEVRALLDGGAQPEWTSFGAIGYREIASYLQGRISLDEAISTIRRSTRRLVRQQGRWFKTDDRRINWISHSEVAKGSHIDVAKEWIDEKNRAKK